MRTSDLKYSLVSLIPYVKEKHEKWNLIPNIGALDKSSFQSINLISQYYVLVPSMPDVSIAATA
jgi:hypothetical protein